MPLVGATSRYGNSLKTNSSKSKSFIFVFDNNTLNSAMCRGLFVEVTLLENANSAELLGMHIDQWLTWKLS